MKIWIFHNYSSLPEHGQFTRAWCMGKYLKKAGHEPVVFVGSHPHNTELQLINGNKRFEVYKEEPFPWVLVKTCKYCYSKVKRVFSMFQFYFNSKKAAKQFGKPDVILGSSAHPLTALLAIRLGKKYKCKKIVEIRDLWPASIVEYGVASPGNPIIKLLYRFEKYLYTHADAVVFVGGGMYDYIKEQGWDKEIPESKIHCLSNGVDLQDFNYGLEHYSIEDPDLDDPNTFKFIYTGSIRKVNDLGILLDTAKHIKNPKIRILVWGNGNELEHLKQRIIDEDIKNVIFKGNVDKKYIPYITSKADVNLMHNTASPLFRFGISMNKLFDYFAAGKPVLIDFPSLYSPVEKFNAGISVDMATPQNIAAAMDSFSEMSPADYLMYCENSKKAAEYYGYENIANTLISIAENI